MPLIDSTEFYGEIPNSWIHRFPSTYLFWRADYKYDTEDWRTGYFYVGFMKTLIKIMDFWFYLSQYAKFRKNSQKKVVDFIDSLFNVSWGRGWEGTPVIDHSYNVWEIMLLKPIPLFRVSWDGGGRAGSYCCIW